MDQQILTVDNFYDVALLHHQNCLENKCTVSDELIFKISSLLQTNVSVFHSSSHSLTELSSKNQDFNVISDHRCNWIAIIYLTLPPDCIMKRGLKFYIHKKTKYDRLPDDTHAQIDGWNSLRDIEKSFDFKKEEDWEEYFNTFVKYNRMVLFKAGLWHSYGKGFGKTSSDSLLFQRILLNGTEN